jgi:hypothetical protein
VWGRLLGERELRVEAKRGEDKVGENIASTRNGPEVVTLSVASQRHTEEQLGWRSAAGQGYCGRQAGKMNRSVPDRRHCQTTGSRRALGRI